MSIKQKIFILLVTVCFTIVLFAAFLITPKIKTVSELGNLEQLTQLGVKVSALVHELQKERGLSAGFSSSGDNKFRAMLQKQRQLTDEKRVIFEEAVEALKTHRVYQKIASAIHTTQTKLSNLSNYRTNTSAQKYTAPQVIRLYSEINTLLLKNIDHLSEISINKNVSLALIAFSSFLNSKENSGIERAVLSSVFNRDRFKEGEFKHLLTLIAKQNTFLDIFKKHAPAEQIQYYERTVLNSDAQKVDAMRNVATERVNTGGFGIQGSVWFQTITRKINNLKTVEGRLINDLLEQSKAIKREALNALLLYLVFTLLISVGLGFFIYKLSVSILTPLNELVEIFNKVEKGKLDQRFKSDQAGEMGVISHALNSLIESLEAKAHLTQSVAEGDLTQKVIHKSEDDVLAQALDGMTQGLTKIIGTIHDQSMALIESANQFNQASAVMADSIDTTKNQIETVANTTEEISINTSTVATGAKEMSVNIQSIAATATQMSANVGAIEKSVKVITDSIQEIANKSKQSVYVANEAKEMSDKGVDIMQTLDTSAQEINTVTEVIKELSQQTNLLALNANIEAATAGVAGKGFAVVANEVKELAKQSSAAAGDIAQNILSMQEGTSKAKENMTLINEIINEVNTSSQDITNLSDTQSASITEIHANVQESTTGVAEVARLIEELSITASEGARNSSEIELGTKEISKSTHNVSMTIQDAVSSVSQMKQEAKGVNSKANELKDLVEQFKLNKED